MLEKQRTRRINEQIESLRALLDQSGLTDLKRDKFSVLANTARYIELLQRQLAQERASKAAAEAKLTAADPPVASFSPRGSVPPSPSVGSEGTLNLPRPPLDLTDAELRHDASQWDPGRRMDYELLFLDASIAMAVSGVDGHFIDCNRAFERLSGFRRDEIRSLSMFSMTKEEEMQELFNVVGSLLASDTVAKRDATHFRKVCRFKNGAVQCFVSIWLVRRPDGAPAYFQCAALPFHQESPPPGPGTFTPTPCFTGPPAGQRLSATADGEGAAGGCGLASTPCAPARGQVACVAAPPHLWQPQPSGVVMHGPQQQRREEAEAQQQQQPQQHQQQAFHGGVYGGQGPQARQLPQTSQPQYAPPPQQPGPHGYGAFPPR